MPLTGNSSLILNSLTDVVGLASTLEDKGRTGILTENMIAMMYHIQVHGYSMLITDCYVCTTLIGYCI